MLVCLFNIGAIWGAIGTYRFFGTGAPYASLMWGWLIGFALPFVPWVIFKFIYPAKWLKYIHFPIFLAVNLAGQLQNTIVMNLLFGFIFQFVIFRYYQDWFKKYAYTFAVAMSCSVALAVVLINFVKFIRAGYVGDDAEVFPPLWVLNPNEDYPDFYCTAGMDYMGDIK